MSIEEKEHRKVWATIPKKGDWKVQRIPARCAFGFSTYYRWSVTPKGTLGPREVAVVSGITCKDTTVEWVLYPELTEEELEAILVAEKARHVEAAAAQERVWKAQETYELAWKVQMKAEKASLILAAKVAEKAKKARRVEAYKVWKTRYAYVVACASKGSLPDEDPS